jgi:hypothetical protein
MQRNYYPRSVKQMSPHEKQFPISSVINLTPKTWL